MDIRPKEPNLETFSLGDQEQVVRKEMEAAVREIGGN